MIELKFRRVSKAPNHYFVGYVFPSDEEDFDAATGMYQITPNYVGKDIVSYEIVYTPMHRRGAVLARRERVGWAGQYSAAIRDAQRHLETRRARA